LFFCIFVSVEVLNRAIERIVDRQSPEIPDFARAAKNLGATAVFFLLAAAGVFPLAATADSAGISLRRGLGPKPAV
jgi:diacylglycerol kinase